ncbi:kinase-like domain-containing protein [Apodospora peruviana]|uniref:Kinase-like domain-containing protein n=1 Tax=Apodospora peruviana TaxID=516989 RepID=A0AAE0I6W1_9PEZI|nr:kinase-like domain-containing protein [Apodospora peruviana]
MARPTESEKANLQTQVSQFLSRTKYACTELTQLSGGTANFVYRGTLAEPLRLSDGSTTATVVIKHSTDYVAINRDFPLDITRCIYEETILLALQKFTPPPTNVVKAPHLLHFDPAIHTSIMQDFFGAVDLKTAFVSSLHAVTPSVCESIGRHLGIWLRAFHEWASAPEQTRLRSTVINKPMRSLKRLITYDCFIEVLEQFPEVWSEEDGDDREMLEQVKQMADKEFERQPDDCDETDTEQRYHWGIIHGDLWSGNVLVPESSSEGESQPQIMIIDWELSQFGHRAYDLGQMIGDLYERKYFNGAAEGAQSAIRGFVEGFAEAGQLSDVFAFRVAIHAGVHLINWYRRRPKSAPILFSAEQITAALTMGKNFVRKGWERDRHWFEGTEIVGLFPNTRRFVGLNEHY